MSQRQRTDRVAREADAALLARRLDRLGLPSGTTVRVHTNRTVMVSANGRGVVRIHRGYAYAPDEVLRAVVTFLSPRKQRSERRAARGILLGFPVERFVESNGAPYRQAQVSAVDRALVERLEAAHRAMNPRHFDGALLPVPIRVSRKMTTCLGAVSIDAATGEAREIVISRRHLESDPWHRVQETLLHEMVHQWQIASGFAPNHGRRFKEKARQIGITPAACSPPNGRTHRGAAARRM